MRKLTLEIILCFVILFSSFFAVYCGWKLGLHAGEEYGRKAEKWRFELIVRKCAEQGKL